jgi:hypothetical protein
MDSHISSLTIASTLPEFHGFRSGICDYVAVGFLNWSSTYQPYISKDIDCQPVLFIWSVRSVSSGSFIWFVWFVLSLWFVWSVSFIWLNQTNSMNQIDQTNQIDQMNQPVQNRADRPIPTLVFLMELDSKLSLRLERWTPPNPWMESVRR